MVNVARDDEHVALGQGHTELLRFKVQVAQMVAAHAAKSPPNRSGSLAQIEAAVG